MMYEKLYNDLCERGHLRKDDYRDKDLMLHAHHVIPTHSGGLDIDANITYLTIREHVISHFLLWKMHQDPNDLRAMHMLGARLTRKQRQVVGYFCRDNNIGFFGATPELRKEWRRKGALSQMETGTAIHTKDSKKRAEWASMGGKVGALSQMETGTAIHTKDSKKRAEWASMGGKSHIGKRWIHLGNKKLRCPSDEVQEYLNDGWKIGMVDG